MEVHLAAGDRVGVVMKTRRTGFALSNQTRSCRRRRTARHSREKCHVACNNVDSASEEADRNNRDGTARLSATKAVQLC